MAVSCVSALLELIQGTDATRIQGTDATRIQGTDATYTMLFINNEQKGFTVEQCVADYKNVKGLVHACMAFCIAAAVKNTTRFFNLMFVSRIHI